jgi:hypothetical protein
MTMLSYPALEILESVKDSIESNSVKLKNVIELVFPEENFNELLQRFIERIKLGEIDNYQLVEYWTEDLFRSDGAPSMGPFYFSFMCLALALRAISEGDEGLAWATNAKASYYIGLTEGSFNLTLQLQSNHNNDVASSGGHASAKNRERARIEAAKLLESKKPATGWNSYDHAADAILEDLKSYIAANVRTFRAPHRVRINLMRWLKEDQDVHEKFLQTCNQLVKFKF